MNGISYNYYALYVSILADIPPEAAFWRLRDGANEEPCKGAGKSSMYTDDDVAEMVDMQNNGWRLKEIGRVYGLNHEYVCRLMSKWRKAHGEKRKFNHHSRKANNKKE